MTNSTKLQGYCLCRQCCFSAVKTDQDGVVCHCEMCRKWTGGIFLVINCGNSVVFEQNAPISCYKSSDWGERIFCKNCGSSLVWQTQDRTHQHASIQCFENPEQFKIMVEIFIDRKPVNYALKDIPKQIPQAEIYKFYSAQEDAQ